MCSKDPRILALESDSPCAALMLFWSSAAPPLPVLCSWWLLSCSHRCSTSTAAAELTAVYESLACTTSKTDTVYLAPYPHSQHIPRILAST